MNCPDCGREIKQEKYSGGESYPKYHRAVDCIANLRADLAERTLTQEHVWESVQLHRECIKERDEARAKVERLRNFINRFARHDDGDVDGTEECREYRDGPDTCDCGYSKALEQALSAAPPPAAKETP